MQLVNQRVPSTCPSTFLGSIPTPIRVTLPVVPRTTPRMGSHLRQDPFELSNLLHAGVLVVTLSSIDKNLSHAVFREVWPSFNQDTVDILRPFCPPQDITLLEGLPFLIEHQFAHVTSNFLSFHPLILLRVYLIPFDLPGVQGRLMNRQEHILIQYRRVLKGILPKIISDEYYWGGADALPPNPSLFLPPSMVGAFVDPGKFIADSKITTGLKDYG